MKQRQFLEVVDEDEARQRFESACANLQPHRERVPLDAALGRVLATDACAPVDVPGFDRSNVDGFAVRAADTWGAEELDPNELQLSEVQLAAGVRPPADFELAPGQAVAIATGAVIPRGADAVLMVEDSAPHRERQDAIEVQRALAPGANLTAAGTDLGRGEVVLPAGSLCGSRETGLLAAVGLPEVEVVARPRVGVLSTGDEVRAPGEPLGAAEIYDSNGRILADAVQELGGEAVALGILPDDAERLRAALGALIEADPPCPLVLLSGGTSKGAGDLNHRVLRELVEAHPGSPGVVVHGVALKPGKPLCLARVRDTAIAILPGFPTSAIFTFHEFVAPLVRRLAGRREEERPSVEASAPLRIASAVGRTEYCLVDLVPGPDGLAAYPLGSGSGSVRTYSRADGYVRIDRHTEYVPAGARVRAHTLGGGLRASDLVCIGSHCIGLDWLLSRLSARGLRTKLVAVGSLAGLRALERGEGDLAGTHLLHAESGEYNRPFLPEGVELIGGYGRRQGFVFRAGDPRFHGRSLEELAEAVRAPGVRMVNRNALSGTRILIERFLGGAPTPEQAPEGWTREVKSHHAVVAAVAQGRADWGIALDSLAASHGLGFEFVAEERFELAVPDARRERPGVRALEELLQSPAAKSALSDLGLVP